MNYQIIKTDKIKDFNVTVSYGKRMAHCWSDQTNKQTLGLKYAAKYDFSNFQSESLNTID